MSRRSKLAAQNQTLIILEIKKGDLTRDQFFDKDDAGQRWNRVGRGSAFVTGLCLLGLGVLWEVGQGDRALTRPTPADPPVPVFPVPGQGGATPPAQLPPAPPAR